MQNKDVDPEQKLSVYAQIFYTGLAALSLLYVTALIFEYKEFPADLSIFELIFIAAFLFLCHRRLIKPDLTVRERWDALAEHSVVMVLISGALLVLKLVAGKLASNFGGSWISIESFLSSDALWFSCILLSMSLPLVTLAVESTDDSAKEPTQ